MIPAGPVRRHREGGRSLALILAFLSAAVLAIGVGLMVGTKALAPSTAWSVLTAPRGGLDEVLVWTLRLPRSLAAFVAGAGLGVSGYLLQALTRNPLAGPGLTGVSGGAVAAIVSCFVFLPWLSSAWYPEVGLVGGLLAAGATFWIARGGRGRPLQLALGGVSVSLFLGAVITEVLIRSGPQVPSLLFWLSGGLQGRSWFHLAAMTPWVAAGLIGALACRRILGLLALGEEAAAGMGLQLAFWKPLLLVLAALPVAGVAPVAGPIAFVGLASPHMARLLASAGPGWTVALTAAIGGLTVVVADVVARTAALPRELPVSVVAALFGGPVFIALVLRPDLSISGERRP